MSQPEYPDKFKNHVKAARDLELRESFAMHALTGLLGSAAYRIEIADAARRAWEIADAMMKARGDR